MPQIEVSLGYGTDQLTVRVPQENLAGIFYPKDSLTIGEGFNKNSSSEENLIQHALATPIGTPPLNQLAHGKRRVVIAISDITRPCPSNKILPFVLDELKTAGIADKDITIVIALGLHRRMTVDEIRNSVSPAIYERIKVLNHDPTDTIRLGTTSSGTPVEISRTVVQADLRICIGNIEYHYFAGYSGGAKAILPGCASRAAVTANHAMMVRREAAAGRIDGNPLREDLEEAVEMVGVDFIINVVVDKEHNIQAAVAGDVTTAHRKGCEIIKSRGRIRAPKNTDIVIASAGGSPKDINFYQAHKALESASYFVNDGGVIILVSACPEGFGNKTFEKWMMTADSPEEIISKIKNNFVLGGHKSAAIAAVQQRASIFLVSELENEIVHKMGITPFDDPQIALNQALNYSGPTSKVCVLPQAISVLPERYT